MTAAKSTAEITLKLKRTFAAPREKVFRAWTDPNELKKWWRVQDDWAIPIAEVDLRIGGKYRLGMQSPDGTTPYVVGGIYREVKFPEKLVYTWKWEGSEEAETLVTVVFRELGGDSTQVELTHERFATKEARDKHNEGWKGCLAQLEKLFT